MTEKPEETDDERRERIYAAICDMTDEELADCFAGYIEAAADYRRTVLDAISGKPEAKPE